MQIGYLQLKAPHDRLPLVFEACGLGWPDVSVLGASASETLHLQPVPTHNAHDTAVERQASQHGQSTTGGQTLQAVLERKEQERKAQ